MVSDTIMNIRATISQIKGGYACLAFGQNSVKEAWFPLRGSGLICLKRMNKKKVMTQPKIANRQIPSNPNQTTPAVTK